MLLLIRVHGQKQTEKTGGTASHFLLPFPFFSFAAADKDRCYQPDYPHRDNQEKFSLYTANLCQAIAMEADTQRQKHRVQQLSQSDREMPKAAGYTLEETGGSHPNLLLKYYACQLLYSSTTLIENRSNKSCSICFQVLTHNQAVQRRLQQSSRKFSQENKHISQPTLRNNSTNTRTNT